MVLDGVVSSALKDFGDFSPFVINDSVHEEKNPLFLLAPVDFLDHWVEMVMPAFTALLSDTVWKVLGNECPFLWTVAFYEL